MEVKTIFKVLLGTIALMITSCIIIELYNVSMTSTQINRLINISGAQAADLFAQETYKTDTGDAGSSSMPDVRTADGGTYVSGNFYGGLSTENAIYNKLYRDSSEFRQFVANNSGKWLSLDCIAYGLGVGGGGLDQASQLSGQMYVSNCVTPLNMGVPYLDQETLQKMFRWNLATLLSNGNSNLIVNDSSGGYYVLHNGFRVYASQATIEPIYRTYDISNASEALEFYELTHINPAGLNGSNSTLTFGTYIPDTESMVTLSNGISYGDERSIICVAGLEYTVPVSYQGVTPMKNIFEYLWNAEVEGWGDGVAPDNPTQTWTMGKVNLQSGGFQDSSTEDTPVPGKLIYYMIR